MSELKSIPLSLITMISNYRDVEPVTEKAPDIIELSESIKKHGLMQPVLLRPGKKADSYELIFGHRRYIAMKLAGFDSIPANIKTVADEDILELQVTENLQRKDVHPMDEAVAFKSLMDQKKYSIEEISLRFAKNPIYIAQRLKLNDLIPEVQKKFKSNAILLGHVMLLARLTAADQLEVIKSRPENVTIHELKDHIERHIEHDLTKARFDIKDPELFPQAGACLTCPKKSGNAPLLFSDLKSPNKCFDKKCFNIKSEKGFMVNLQNIIDTRPEIKLIRDRHRDMPKAVNEILQKTKVPTITDDECSTSTWSGSSFKTKAQGFYLNGWDAGKTETIYLRGKAKIGKDGKPAAEDKAAIIAGINERAKRSKVLDQCKIHSNIIEALKDRKELVDKPFPFQKIDRGIMIYLIMSVANLQHDVVKGIPEAPDRHGYQPEYFMKLAALPDEKLAMIIRIVVKDKFANQNLNYGIREEDTPIKLIAEYLGIDTAAIIAEQKVISDKREARAKERIKALNVKKPAAKKPAIKKKVAKAKKK